MQGTPYRISWAPHVDLRLEFTDEMPSSVHTVHLAPFVGDDIVLIQSNGRWELPGGRLDSGETAAGAAERELMEEAGAALRGAIDPFAVLWFRWRDDDGAWGAWFAELIAACDVAIVGPPTNPPGEVQTDEVRAVSLAEACALLAGDDRLDLVACCEAAVLRRPS